MSVGLLKQNGRTVMQYDVLVVDSICTYAKRSKRLKLWMPLLMSMLQCCLAICFIFVAVKLILFHNSTK